ncbi:MAG: sugar ABC transporter permease [Oscillospiraceae bacterium]|jgi:ABC-type sugar transport system permease subunit|nr:sugar ABC transporter permease [Oscillospiraceae bacterium]
MKNAASAVRTARGKSALPFWKRDGFIGYLFILPSLIGFAAFVAYPMIMAIGYSFTEWDGLSPARFIGVENYTYMFTTDPSFPKAIKATFLYVLMTVPLTLVFGLLLAVMLNKNMFSVKVLRTLFYLPVVLPSVAALVLWKFVYDPDYGLINQLLAVFGIQGPKWLQSEDTALVSMSIVAIWGVGSMMIIFLSGLQSISAEIYEAADVDGANGIQKFFKITIPMMSPVLFLQLITGLIGAFQAFNPPQLLTNYSGAGGGPNYATYLLAYSIYDKAFNGFKYGYAMAQVMVLFVIILAFTIVVFKSSDAYVYYENN